MGEEGQVPPLAPPGSTRPTPNIWWAMVRVLIFGDLTVQVMGLLLRALLLLLQIFLRLAPCLYISESTLSQIVDSGVLISSGEDKLIWQPNFDGFFSLKCAWNIVCHKSNFNEASNLIYLAASYSTYLQIICLESLS